jgi:hypothetical protein
MVGPPKSREGSGRAAVPRPDPETGELTAAAELRIELRRDRPPADEASGAGQRWPARLRWLVPAAIGLRVTVPATESEPMLRMLERVTFAIAWPTGVIGSLFGAAAAHLPAAGTTLVVVLEIVIPAVVLRGYRRRGSGRPQV